jgi:diamine N-acetyltransferase
MLHPADWKLRGYTDAHGREYRVRLWEPRDLQAMTLMYLSFTRDDGFAGIPPRDTLSLGRWLGRLTRHGMNAVACSGSVVAAHAVLVPSAADACELAVCVHPRHRRTGLGYEVARGLLDFAADFGVGSVWASVDGWNLASARLARRLGFRLHADGFWRIDLRPRPVALHQPEPVALPAAAAPA